MNILKINLGETHSFWTENMMLIKNLYNTSNPNLEIRGKILVKTFMLRHWSSRDFLNLFSKEKILR